MSFSPTLFSPDFSMDRKNEKIKNPRPFDMESILIDAPCMTIIGRHAIAIIGTLSTGAFLTESAIRNAYSTRLNALPNHNSQIAFKSNNLAKNTPNA